MRAVIQRVKHASVTIADQKVAAIHHGLLIFLGIGHHDQESDCEYLIDKILHLRVFENQQGKMHYSVMDRSLGLLIVPQFTIMGTCLKGRRPDFTLAAPPEKSESLFQFFVDQIKKRWPEVQTGQFKTHMEVELLNDGPVTLIVDSKEKSGLK